MRIHIEKEFEEIISTMLHFKACEMRIDACVKYDFEGGLSSFGLILSSMMEGAKPFLKWCSGYDEKLIFLARSSFFSSNYDKIYCHLEEEWIVNKYGKSSEDMDDDEYEYPWGEEVEKIKREAFQKFCLQKAEEICNSLYDELKKGEIDNCFYGCRDENGHPVPRDYGYFNVSFNGKIVLTCKFGENSN